jgi:hypothetical protein
VTRIDPGVVSRVAELRGHERRAAEELEQGKTHDDLSTKISILLRDGRALTEL